ncbi:ABC-type antimicrobial peptide transport system, ATPase component [hydrothermal vent metagenome]|uniref:ABC-type antimicrobial peptide transport system, ATPase component n=1 Tax=hydrothermal vent metagenome TaxID=652676 RepID=A0A3B1ARC2_9ZZZZ
MTKLDSISDSSNLSSTIIIQAVNLCKRVTTSEGVLTLLDDINFSVNKGTSLAILGASGSGKTTLLGLLAGLDVASSGQSLFNGSNLGDLDEDGRAELRANSVGFVFQSFQLLSGLTAIENVMLPLELAGDKKARQDAQDILKRVGLAQRETHYPMQLSGGEQQRCAIARAFAVKPTLLFADEPTGNLDQLTGKKIIDLLFELNHEQGTTLIMATHDESLANKCDARIELEAGRIQ